MTTRICPVRVGSHIAIYNLYFMLIVLFTKPGRKIDDKSDNILHGR